MTANAQGLGAEEIGRLRVAYRPELLVAATRGALSGTYPPGAPFVGSVVDLLYGDEPVKPKDRERSLIALLGARQESMNLAIHIYWGLMEGLSPEEIGHTLLLVGAYTGIPGYSTSMVVYAKTFALLKVLAGKGGDAVHPIAVAQELMKAFGM